MPSSGAHVQLALAPARLGRREASALARDWVEARARSAWDGVRAEPAPASWAWARTGPGKPFLAEWPEFDFSISHCGPYVGVAFADAACGLDLEVAGRSVDLSVARRFAAVERDYILTAPPALAPERFLEVWVKKEAYLKWLGQGLGAGLGSFSVLDPGRLGVTFARLAPGPRGDLVGWVCLGGAGPNDSDLEPAETLSQDWITIPG